jgi:hypothetical protein
MARLPRCFIPDIRLHLIDRGNNDLGTFADRGIANWGTDHDNRFHRCKVPNRKTAKGAGSGKEQGDCTRTS